MSNVAINIAAEFKGKPAFKEAATATDKLNKNVKTLGKSLLAVYSAQKLISFARLSVKAFAEDDKAAQALGITLKNLGLAYGSNIGTVNGFISRLESQTGVLDDQLRPAMDGLLRATGSVTKAQELLALSLDIAAGTGKSVVQVSTALQRAYLGQTTGLSRLGAGLTKTELATASFEEIQLRLSSLFAGQATAAADTYAGSLAKLTVAGENAKETIGKSLVDALVTASNSTSIDDLTSKINTAAEAMGNFIREAGKFIRITKSIFEFDLFFKDPDAFKGMGNISMTVSSQDTQRADAIAKKNATAITKLTKEQAKNQAKILKDKRLQNAIDKANLALNAGTDIFDMDKIQVAAALTNQAQQLGRATSAAQVLQIANDTARLNVKKSIADLEDAIAAKDEQAIIKATAKLNEDVKILNALTGQKNQMAAIESILNGLKSKDLINQANLDEALRKIKLMMEELAKIKFPTPTSSGGGGGGSTGGGSTGGSTTILGTAAIEALTAAQAEAILATMPSSVKTNLTPAQISGNRYEAQALDAFNKAVEKVGLATQTAQNSFLNGIQAGLNIPAAMSGSRYAAQGIAAAGGQGYVINIQTGVGDPNAIAEAIDEVLRQARDRGTLTIA